MFKERIQSHAVNLVCDIRKTVSTLEHDYKFLIDVLPSPEVRTILAQPRRVLRDKVHISLNAIQEVCRDLDILKFLEERPIRLFL